MDRRPAGRNAGAVAVALLLLTPAADAGWNPLKALGHAAGTFVDGAITPTLENAEASGHRLIGDVDDRLGRRIDAAGDRLDDALAQADRSAEARVAQVNVVARDRLTQSDSILTARIAQIDVAGNALVDKSLGRLDRISRERIDQAARESNKLVTRLDDVTQRRLAQADAILEARITQVHEAVQASISQADEAIEQRLQQLDEMAERRIGSLDVVATKQGLSFEGTFLKGAALAAMLAFLVIAFRYILKEAPLQWRELSGQTFRKRLLIVSAYLSTGVGARLLAALAGVGVLSLLAVLLPIGPRNDALKLTSFHADGLESSLSAFDFTRVRYHAAQLSILAPEQETRHRALLLKAELIRALFTRPSLLRRTDGLRHVMTEVARAESAFRAARKDDSALPADDPDLLVLKGYILWQVAGTKEDEYEAVTFCARALEIGQQSAVSRPATALLRPLAVNYVRSYLYRPLPFDAELEGLDHRYDAARLWAIADAAGETPEFAPLQHLLEYDRLVAELDRGSSAAYLAMLEAQAEVEAAVTRRDAPAAATARAQRGEQARAVIESWRAFDERLRTNPWLAGTSSMLAVFTLNDAVLSQALWFEANPDDPRRAPRITREPRPQVRAQMAPIRIEWARRLVNPLGQNVRRVVQYEEAERFRRFEDDAAEFQDAFVDYQAARADASTDAESRRRRAAVGSARLGLYAGEGRTRAALAVRILGPGPALQQEDVKGALLTRRLRFL
jgi:hypothetical protein